jgi:hypothetical protein
MSTLLKCKVHTSTNGDIGLVRLDHIHGMDEKVYRYNEAAGGMEYAARHDFDVMGWNARTYWTLLDPMRFHVTKRKVAA